MRTNLVRKFVRVVTIPAAVVGITAVSIAPASADPCISVADCQLRQEAADGDPNAGLPGSSSTVLNLTDSFWEDVLDFFAGSGWDF